MALVIKEWWASSTPNAEGTYISITGREAGLVSYLLSLVGVDPTTHLQVTARNIVYEQGSLGGFSKKVIPLRSLSSGYFGYTKPWREALSITIGTLGLGLPLALLYYFLNKRLLIGVVESGGLTSGMVFKRSVIEGKAITEEEGKQVIALIEWLVNQT